VLFENICSLANFMTREKKIAFRSRFDNQIPEILYVDENRIWQIFINLINNAVKFTQNGEVSFSVRKATLHGKAFIRAVVTDTGPGIKKEDLEKIFLSFEQVDRRLHHDIPGTGLGLAITKNLITLMGGTIKVKSVYGEGSDFTVMLPLVEGKISKLNTELDIHDFVYIKNKNAVSVLVVDDLPINQTVLSGFLEMHNIVPDIAENGRKAVKKAQNIKYDLIFMDHMMSDMDGIAATKHIRDIPGYENTPIIAVSANAISEYKTLYLRSGMNDFVSKPVNAKRINDVLAKWLPEDKLEHGNRRQTQRRKNTGRILNGRRAGETVYEEKIFDNLKKIEGLDVQTGLNHTGNKVKGYITVLRQFIDNLDESAAKFIQYKKSKEWVNLSVLAHAYKGVFAIIGYKSLFVWSRKMEYAAKCLSGELKLGKDSANNVDIDKDSLPSNLKEAKLICESELDAYIKSVIAFRDKLVKHALGRTAPKKKKTSHTKLITLLKELNGVCKSYKAKDGEIIIKQLRQCGINKKVDADILEIIHLVNGFDYERAAIKIKELEAAL
jgi:CheY-like chemotaxis protein